MKKININKYMLVFILGLVAWTVEAQTVDASSAVPNNNVAGTTISFHTAEPPTAGNEVAANALTAGTKYFTYFKGDDGSGGDCYSSDGSYMFVDTGVNSYAGGDVPAPNNLPAGSSTSLHSGKTPTTGNELANVTTSGLYYVAFKGDDGSGGDCYVPEATPIYIAITTSSSCNAGTEGPKWND